MPRKPTPTPGTDRRHQNPGRPPLSGTPSVYYALRLTPEQRAKLERLGGAAWIRDRINHAK